MCIILHWGPGLAWLLLTTILLTYTGTLLFDINVPNKLQAKIMKLTIRTKAWKDFFLAFLKKGLSLFKQFTWCFMVLLEENYSKWHSKWVVWTHKPLLIKTAIIFQDRDNKISYTSQS